MAFEDLSLRDYLKILYRRKRVVLVVFLISAVLTALVAFNQQDRYIASSRIKVQQQRTFADFISRMNQARPVESIDNYIEEMTSYKVLSQVVRTLTPGDDPSYQEVARLQQQVKIVRLPKTDLVDIWAESASGEEAKDVVNALANIFVQYHQENITRTARQMKEQIEEWRNQIMTQLYADERALKEFREQFGVIDIASEGQNLLSQIASLDGQMMHNETQLSRLNGQINRWNNRIGQYLAGADLSPEELIEIEGLVGDSQYLTGVKTQLFDMQLKRMELVGSGTYTTNHPSARHVDLLIDTARREANTERKRIMQTIMEELINQRYGVEASREKLQQQMNRFTERLQKLPDLERESRNYIRRKDVSEQLYTFLSQKLEEAKISELERSEIAFVVSPAVTASQVQAGRARTLLAGLLLGLILGVAMAFVAENLDTSIATIEIIEQLFNIPVIGVIPHITGSQSEKPERPRTLGRAMNHWYLRPVARKLQEFWKYVMGSHGGVQSEQGIELIAQFDPKSPAAEAYRTVRTNLEYYCRNTGAKVILFSSSGPMEGKSVTLTNVAVAMAQLGRKVLIVGANLRRPSLGRIFGISEEPGLSDIILENHTWRETVKDMADMAVGEFSPEQLTGMPGLDNLSIITSGGVAAQPSELLASERMGQLLQEVREEFDYILIDSPPVLPVPDGVILGRRVDAVVLIYQLGNTTREAMRRAVVGFNQTNARIAGLVLNDLQADWAAGGEFFQYRFYYGQEGHKRMPWEKGNGSGT